MSTPRAGATMRSNRSGRRQTRFPSAPAPSEVPTATVAPNASATASTSREKSSKRYPDAGALERPWPRKSNRTFVPGMSGVNAASSFRLFVRPCAKTMTGSPSPSTAQNRVASSVVISGTDPTYRRSDLGWTAVGEITVEREAGGATSRCVSGWSSGTAKHRARRDGLVGDLERLAAGRSPEAFVRLLRGSSWNESRRSRSSGVRRRRDRDVLPGVRTGDQPAAVTAARARGPGPGGTGRARRS